MASYGPSRTPEYSMACSRSRDAPFGASATLAFDLDLDGTEFDRLLIGTPDPETMLSHLKPLARD